MPTSFLHRSRTIAPPKPSHDGARQPTEGERRAFADYRHWVQRHYDGLPGALTTVTGALQATVTPALTTVTGVVAPVAGVARGAWEFACKYAKERKQFGKSISDFQGIQFQIAQMATDIEAARLMVYNAARMKDAGMPFVKEAAMAKLFASQVAERVTSLAIEIYGGYGFTKDYPVEKYWRDSKIGKIYEGTSNMQLATIAKLVMVK